MEGIGGLGFGDISGSMRKKRSNTSRRPWNESQPHSDFHDVSSFSSTPHSYNVCKTSCNDNNDYNPVFQKKEETSLKQCSSRASFNIGEAESSQNMVKAGEGGFVESDEASNNSSFRGSNGQRHSGVDSRRPGEGVLARANWRGLKYLDNLGDASDVLVNENKVKKVKLKVGGVTRTINTKSASDAASAIGSCSTKSSHFPDAPRLRPMMIQDNNSDDHLSFPSDKGVVPLKEFTRSEVGTEKGDCLRGQMVDENMSMEKTDTYEPLRKSKRVPKRRFFDEQLDDDDYEIQYLENNKTANLTTIAHGLQYDDDEDGGGRRKHRRMSKVLKKNIDSLYDDVDISPRLGNEGKKHRPGRIAEDVDYVEDHEEEEEAFSDRKPEKKNQCHKKEMMVITRQRALQTGKHGSSSSSPSLIQFPNGLPPPPSRKQKDKLTDLEQQMKKAETAQRRRMQVEKAARESEAEAIRKILGQESSRKKREEKIKKRQEELAKERFENAGTLPSDTVRWVMGPSGTVVTFPTEVGLPNLFDPRPCSYPPPREKCAGPSCTNPYKYRHSKSKLPLCSLQCYKALNHKMAPLNFV